jgi:hypothetical protein
MGKTVLITGAASSFGHGVAFGLARRGHKVIAGCRIWPQVWELRNAARADNIGMQVIKLDVLNEIDRAKAFAIETEHIVQQCRHHGIRADGRDPDDGVPLGVRDQRVRGIGTGPGLRPRDGEAWFGPHCGLLAEHPGTVFQRLRHGIDQRGWKIRRQ